MLENPAMPGIHKIGKTTRDPFIRLSELSASTGIPTPFTLIFQQPFKDCHKAEQQIHSILTAKNNRLSNNREFFTTPLNDIIQLILELKKEELETEELETVTNPELIDDIDDTREENGAKLLQQAISSYLGLGDCIEDHFEAKEIFSKACNLGVVKSNRWLAMMNYYGHGGNKSEKNAFDYLKKGAKAGDNSCLVLLAGLSAINGRYQNLSNSKKYWDHFEKNIKKMEVNEENFIYLYGLICHRLNEASDNSIPSINYANWEYPVLLDFLSNKIARQENTKRSMDEEILFHLEDFFSNFNAMFTVFEKKWNPVERQLYYFPKSDEDLKLLVYVGKTKMSINNVVDNYLYFGNPRFSEKGLYMKSEQFVENVEENRCFPVYTHNRKEYIEHVIFCINIRTNELLSKMSVE
ncbi:GIY-YIG nuclease family protein [Sporosarcina sp. NCCP-2716]|uniref:GIY-YIG nuclease family protein n=1 Tax=Sporosarcina sp. NCCP-2716 TaxID=2943679 RepID=UPI00203F931B|nr:GIY-YIG nuclease family protein [Sporosarcina sp. NCCP-2716]